MGLSFALLVICWTRLTSTRRGREKERPAITGVTAGRPERKTQKHEPTNGQIDVAIKRKAFEKQRIVRVQCFPTGFTSCKAATSLGPLFQF